MKLEHASDELLELYRSNRFEWLTHQGRTGLTLKGKLTKPLKAEIEQLMRAFGGQEYRRQTWEFSYNIQPDIDMAVYYGYYPTAMDNVCLLPPHLSKQMTMTVMAASANILNPFPGYGDIVVELDNRLQGFAIDTVCGDGLEDFYAYDNLLTLTALDNLSDLRLHYDTIVYRPPFSGKQDAELIMRLYESLKPGGQMITFIKSEFEYSTAPAYDDFRGWCKNKNIRIVPVNAYCWTRTGEINVSFFFLSKETK